MRRWLLVLVAFFIFASEPAFSASIPGTLIAADGLSAQQLYFGAGWYTDGYDLWAVRNYVAENFPRSPEGVAASAWLADYAGRKDDALGLFRKCFAMPETSAYCGSWLLDTDYRTRISQKEFDAVSALADSLPAGAMPDPWPLFADVFFYRTEVLKDEAPALHQLAAWEAKYPEYKAIFLIIRARFEEFDKKDYSQAWNDYTDATQVDPTFPVARDGQIDLIVDHLDQAPFLRLTKDVGAVVMAEEAKVASDKNPTPLSRWNASQVLVHAGDRLATDLKLYATAARLYAEAYALHPSGDTMKKVVDTDANAGESYRKRTGAPADPMPDAIRDRLALLTKANADLGGNPLVLHELGSNLLNYDRMQAEAYLRQALAMPLPVAMQSDVASDIGIFVYDQWGDFHGARAVYRKYMDVDRAGMLAWLIQNREYAGDVEGARDALADLRKFHDDRHDANEAWFASQERLLARMSGRAEPRGASSAADTSSEIPLAAPLETDADIALSADDKMVAVGDHPVELRDAATGALIRVLGRGGSERAFSPDGKYFATASTFTEDGGIKLPEIVIYDTASGRIVADIPHNAEVNQIAWDFTGKRLAFITDTTIGIYDIARHAIAGMRLRPYSAPPHDVVWLPGDGALAVSYAWGTDIHIFDAGSLALTRILSGGRYPHGMAVSGDKRFLAIDDNEHDLTVWRLDDLAAAPRTMHIDCTGWLSADPRGSNVLIKDIFGSDSHVLELVDLNAMKVLARTESPVFGDASFSRDGTAIYRAGRDAIEMRDPRTLALVRQLQDKGAVIENTAYDPVHGVLLVSDRNGTAAWDIASRGREYWWPGVHLLRQHGWAAPYVARADDGHTQSVVVLDTVDFHVQTLGIVPADVTLDVGAVRGSFLAVGGVQSAPPGTQMADGDVGKLLVYDLAQQRLAGTVAVPVSSAYGTFPNISDPRIESIDVSADGQRVVYTTSWTDGFHTGTTRANVARVVDLGSGKISGTVDYGAPVYSVNFSADENAIEGGLDSEKSVRAIDDGRVLSRNSDLRRGRTVVDLLTLGGTVAYDADRLTRTDGKGRESTRAFPGNLQTVFVDEPRSLLIAMTSQNEVELLDLDTLAPATGAR